MCQLGCRFTPSLVKVEDWSEAMRNLAKRLLRGDEGGALVEYSLLIALIVTVCIIVVAVLGNKTSQMYSEMTAKFF